MHSYSSYLQQFAIYAGGTTLSSSFLENIHLHLWLLKDLSWAQDWYYAGLFFGSLAVAFSFLLFCSALISRATNEIFFSAAVFVWVFANLWWMSGDMRTPQNLNVSYDASRSTAAGYIMLGGLCWLTVLYLVIKPLSLLDCNNPETISQYNRSGMKTRWPLLFSTWREYENIHIFFWLGKDFAWNTEIPSLWILFAIPTILISVDFVCMSFHHEPDASNLDLIHYSSQLLWIIGNVVWAGGELFDPKTADDFPYSLLSRSSDALRSPRWYGSWLLLLAFLPATSSLIIVMHRQWRKRGNDDASDAVRYKALNKSYGTCSSDRFAGSDAETEGILGNSNSNSSSKR